MNHKRHKPRTQVKCTLCTSGRMGNSMKDADKKAIIKDIEEEISKSLRICEEAN